MRMIWGDPTLEKIYRLGPFGGLFNLKSLFRENIVEKLAVCLHVVHDEHPGIRGGELFFFVSGFFSWGRARLFIHKVSSFPFENWANIHVPFFKRRER